ncbi:putative ATP-dependent RNA helicase DDX28 [Glandiceps talaboti]
MTGCVKCTALRLGFPIPSLSAAKRMIRPVTSLQEYVGAINHSIITRKSSTATSPDNVIRIPKPITKKLEKQIGQPGPFKFRGRLFIGRPGKQIITAKRPEFNHYQNQFYDKFKPPKLASDGWKHKKSYGDYFTINSTRGNPAIPNNSEESYAGVIPSFSTFQLHESVMNGLKSMEIERPTKVQIAAIPQILKGHNVLCAAETGSGKTLTYLLPIIHKMKIENEKFGMKSAVGLPRALVLLPARELAEQVLAVARQLAKSVNFSARIVEGGRRLKTLQRTTDGPLDLIVATPGAMLKCLTSGWLHMHNIQYVVVDEIDTMLDDSFKKIVLNILSRIPIRDEPQKSENAQLIMTGATMPRNAEEILGEVVEPEALVTVTTSHLHRLMPHVPQKFMKIHSQDKAGKIIELLEKDVKRNIPVLVFCNTTDSCNWLYRYVQENGLSAIKLNGGMNTEKRVGVFREFQKGRENILICTDIGSRGLDTQHVQHVINFDFPNGMSDYIHRVGRVGRVGAQVSGHVTSFIIHKWDVDLVNKIERSVRRREVLPSVDANIKGKLTRISEAKTMEEIEQL